jgi:hypothetical protein
MKKITLLFAFSLCLMGIHAQNTIMNGDFELWSFGKPVGWTAGLYGTLTSYVNIPVELTFCTQSTDAHTGNYAAKVASADFTIPYVGNSFNMPGIMQVGEAQGFSIPLQNLLDIIQIFQDTTGTSSFDSIDLESLASLTQLASPGVPCSSTPRYVTMWVKYQADEGDQVTVIAATKRNGQFVDYAYNDFDNLSADEYQQISVEFENPGAECDSIMIVVFSALSLNSTSVLYVDDVQLSNGVSVCDFEKIRENVYPNPASDVLYVEVEGDQVYQWTLRDLTGRILKSGDGQGKTAVDVRSYPAGVYMLTFTSEGLRQTRKVVIR